MYQLNSRREKKERKKKGFKNRYIFLSICFPWINRISTQLDFETISVVTL